MGDLVPFAFERPQGVWVLSNADKEAPQKLCAWQWKALLRRMCGAVVHVWSACLGHDPPLGQRPGCRCRTTVANIEKDASTLRSPLSLHLRSSKNKNVTPGLVSRRTPEGSLFSA